MKILTFKFELSIKLNKNSIGPTLRFDDLRSSLLDDSHTLFVPLLLREILPSLSIHIYIAKHILHMYHYINV